MKLLSRILCMLMAAATCQPSIAQCTAASLNWDALDFLNISGSYSTYLTATRVADQYFAFGKNRLRITYSGVTSVGENATFTGVTGSYGAGENVQFAGNGTITISFTTAVSNLKFSWYDNDKGQVTTFVATNSGTATPVVLTPALSSSSDISVVNNSTSSTVTSLSGNKAENSNVTSVNVDVAGSVTSITITVASTNTASGGAGDSEYWLSDIAACITSASFPTNYYTISRPFNATNGLTNQPGYVLLAANKSVYMVDPATGNAKFIFSDGATSGTINSVAYDPYNHIIYYSWSLTNNGSANASEKSLRKYDVTSGTTSVVLSDITSIGVPIYGQGIESGAAAFYDGALYIGIEGGADNGNGGPRSTSTGIESSIWRIDFNSSLVPTSATQVYAVSGDSHDWSDFTIKDGTLYDFNGDATTPDYHHYNMQTGANTLVASVVAPKQAAVGWDGTLYWVSSTIAQYNSAGGTVAGTSHTITANPTIPNFGTSTAPSFGDAAEAFRPRADFGDAPSTYDADALAPAVHELSSTLKIGSNEDVEWTKPTILGTNADADGSDDDGLSYVRILSLNGGNYQTDVNVYNNTGANATLAAWIDFNNDGVFQSSEGIVQTVGSATTTQSKSLYWTGISSTLATNAYTYLRIRITSTTNNMTTANATGYFSDGEVEDYYLPVNTSVLAMSPVHFAVKKIGESKVNITWTPTGEANTTYELERSVDGQTWTTIYTQAITDVPANNASYTYTDMYPTKPEAQYRLRYGTIMQQVQYSQVERITFSNAHAFVVYPNPASSHFTISILAQTAGSGTIELHDISGKTVFTKATVLGKGVNTIVTPVPVTLPAGMYSVLLKMPDALYNEKLLIRR